MKTRPFSYTTRRRLS